MKITIDIDKKTHAIDTKFSEQIHPVEAAKIFVMLAGHALEQIKPVENPKKILTPDKKIVTPIAK
jgi:hypothetical protein